jgi:branched-chain amino acid transport system substrate-binding protein
MELLMCLYHMNSTPRTAKRALCIVSLLLLFSARLCHADSETLRIGATLPLTGPLASYGQLIRGGIELALEDLQPEGYRADLFVDDTPYAGSGSISSLRKLIAVNKVQAIAGNFSNVCMATMAPEIGRARIPTFHTAAADPLISESNDWVLTTNVKIADEARHVAQHIHNLGLKRVAVLSINVNFGQEYRNAFITEARRIGLGVVADETYEKDDPDQRTQLTRIRSTKPEVIYYATFGHFLGFSLKQAAHLGLKATDTLRAFSVYEAEDQSVLDAAAGAADGLQYFVTYGAPDGSNSKAQRFQERYSARFNRLPGTFGSNAYDATVLMVKALSICKGDNLCTRDKLYETANFQGVSGTFSIQPDGAAKKNFRLKQIVNGAFVDRN